MRKNKFFVKSPIICEPRDNMSRALYIVGWISRALVHFVCVFGSCLFIADSFGITSSYIAENNASIGMLALTCLIVSAVTSLCAYNGKTLLITPPVARSFICRNPCCLRQSCYTYMGRNTMRMEYGNSPFG